MLDLAMLEVILSSIVVWFLQKVKQAKFLPWVSSNTFWTNRILAILLAGANALLEEWLTSGFVTTPHPLAIKQVLWYWLENVILQEIIYRATVRQVTRSDPNNARVAPAPK